MGRIKCQRYNSLTVEEAMHRGWCKVCVCKNKKEGESSMNLKQKVRVMRKFADKLMSEQEFCYQEVSAFGAPNEVWDLITESNRKRVQRIMNRLNLTLEEFEEEGYKQIELETKLPLKAKFPENVGEDFKYLYNFKAYNEVNMIADCILYQ